MRFIIFITLLLCLASPITVAAEDVLTMAFNQRPPYHYIDDSNPAVPRGLVADRVVRGLRTTGLDVQYEEMSASRILATVKGKEPFCSFGWFKTPERMQYAKFSRSLLQDEPFVVVVSRQNRELLEKHQTLSSVFSDYSLTFGTRAGMSYGDTLDTLINDAKVQVVAPDNTQINMIKMMDRNRFHFMLLVPVEIEEAFRSAGVDLSKYISVNFPEIPKGNTRHIMCSQGVHDDIIIRINESIEKTVDPSLIN